jgi:hypothetical protein
VSVSPAIVHPIFSVVIPTCRRVEALAALLQRLRPEQQGVAAGEYEVIVSDDDARGSSAAALGERFPA